MKSYTILILFITLFTTSALSKEQVGKHQGIIPVWPGEVPLQQDGPHKPEVWEKWGLINVHNPTLTIYPAPPEIANGLSILVIPGGGYSKVCINHEGHRVANWYNKLGFSAFVLKYRVKYTHPAPLTDAQRAIRYIRYHAEKYNLNPNKIGVIGFSAGGHLASTLSVHYDMKTYEPKDAIDKVSARPDFSILIYPVISMKPGITYGGCRLHLIGKDADENLTDFWSSEKQVDSNTSPAFLVHGTADTAVIPKNSELYIEALNKHDVPAQYYPIEGKGHGFGLGYGWFDPCYKWVQNMTGIETKSSK